MCSAARRAKLKFPKYFQDKRGQELIIDLLNRNPGKRLVGGVDGFSQSTLLVMDSFVAAVDEAPTTSEVQEAVVSALVDAGFTSPEHLVGTADSVIGELAGWLAGPAGGPTQAHVPVCRRRVGGQTHKGRR